MYFFYLEGRIGDVLVKVDKFVFLTDFIIQSFEANEKIYMVLERTFFAIKRTMIYV